LALLTEFYQMVLIEGVMPPLSQIAYLALWACGALAVGIWIYQRNREQFAEAL